MKPYWTCSKFADWLRGTPKLRAGTAEEWSAWRKAAKQKKFRYWLAEEGLDYLQDFIFWPANRISAIRCYINNRWITKSHALTSTLKRGQWHDLDSRLLHAIFDELLNFVEVEKAWKLIVWSSEDRKKYKAPCFLSIRSWRCAEAGIEYLQWEAALKHDEEWINKDDPSFGTPTHQALAAQEILSLYYWWKNERPKRPDPMEASGWSQYCDENRNRDEGTLGFFKSRKNDERARKILDMCHEIEKEQEDEDTAMLIRLIKIRQSLWT